VLFHILSNFLEREISELDKNNIRFMVIGRDQSIPEALQRKISRAEEKTRDNSTMSVVIALNYGGRQEIVDAAGIQKPTLYHYFGSKAGLLHALLEENFAPLFRDLEKAAVYNHDVKTSLEAVANVYFAFARQNPRFYRLQLALWFGAAESEPFHAVSGFNQRQQELLETLFYENNIKRELK